VGLGTYSLKKPELIKWALDCGYRHFDSGSFYMNEAVIAGEIAKYPVPRHEVFVATKIPPKEQGYAKTKAAVEKSIKALSPLGYIDMVLLTFPSTTGLDPKDPKNLENRHESWRALEEFVVSGQVQTIGVSNFRRGHLEKLLDVASIKPAVN